MKVCFKTFGCRLNKAEALQMEADYLAKGWALTKRHAEADLFVVRGCSVTARAQHECEKLIAHLKRHYPSTPLKICGCLTTAHPQSEPRGNGHLARCTSEPLPTRTARAYLKAQDGCSGKCTFCIVPQFRGKSVSTPFDALLDTAKRFIDSGYHEIVVTGCNLSLYCSQGKRLPELVAGLAGLDENCRIRLGSLEPGDCAMETVHALAEHANACRFLHIPVQSGSNQILQSMHRPYLIRDVERLVGLAVGKLPNLGLGCDIMTGFPGESELDFAATKSMLGRLPFNNAHIFPFSERPGTAAAKMENAIPRELRSMRAHELAEVIRINRTRFALSLVGKTAEIVVEDEKKRTGWTGEYVPCRILGYAPRKALVTVRIIKAKDGELEGVKIERNARTHDPDASI